MIEDFWDRTATKLIGLSFQVSVICSAIIIGWQSVMWLKTGIWTPLPFLTIIEYFDVSVEAIYNPTSWHGAAMLGQWILDLPLSLCVPIILVGTSVLWKIFVSGIVGQ